jgi:hypothetical protein
LDERRHRPTADRWWGEAWTFDFAAPDGSVGGYVRLELLPNQGTCWYWAWVVGPGRPPVVVLDHEVPLPRGTGLELRTTGLWADHVVEEPFEHVSVGAEAFALLLDDPAEALGRLVGFPTPFGLDLGWETAGERTDAARGPGPTSQTGATGPTGSAPTVEGYSLPCHVVGEVLVADERIALDGIGHRHHTWGVEDWWSAGWRAVEGRLDDGTWFAGRGDGVASDLVIEPLADAPVPIAGDGERRCHLVRRLCRYGGASSPRSGVGWAEWNNPL